MVSLIQWAQQLIQRYDLKNIDAKIKMMAVSNRLCPIKYFTIYENQSWYELD